MVTDLQGRSITVGLSGGVDSAVAALLLKEAGADVTGIFMKNWEDDDPVCTAEEDFEDVRRVCELLDIPYYSVNFEQEYRERVFTAFLAALRDGLTPNPDVLCNSEIKFASFLDLALLGGAQAIATGHYVRKREDSGTVYLLRGLDPDKDQSYFLCLLTQEQLKNAMFPLGAMQKSEVRSIAKRAGIPVALKKDSTGICFIGERNFKNFLMQHLPSEPGDIRMSDGTKVGRHDGLHYYTLGQRRGLGLGGNRTAGDGRWFVISRDFATNTLYVDHSEEALYTKRILVQGMHYISGEPADSFSCAAKVRYRQPDQKAQIRRIGENLWSVEFSERQRAAAPGQYCVLYDGEVCLGGGLISTG